ncbi:MAG: dihydropteroate synthase, partial [Flavobacteriales bacterium]|nr:dihydropteroate synthase [Flavobacteriales bacterium]
IGGQSTRPGSVPVSEQEELNRVLPAVKAIYSALPEAIISVDTWYARVAEACLDAGASIINDITSGEGDTDMLTVVAKAHVPMVIMHKQGDPQTMQDNPHYTDVVQEVFSYLESRLQAAREAGVHDVIIDPGFGFGKSMEHNLEIVRRFHTLTLLGAPLLAGISRKRMLRTITGADIDDVLPAATAMHMWLLTQGANLLRTHDVKETVQVVKVWEKVKTAYS